MFQATSFTAFLHMEGSHTHQIHSSLCFSVFFTIFWFHVFLIPISLKHVYSCTHHESYSWHQLQPIHSVLTLHVFCWIAWKIPAFDVDVKESLLWKCTCPDLQRSDLALSDEREGCHQEQLLEKSVLLSSDAGLLVEMDIEQVQLLHDAGLVVQLYAKMHAPVAECIIKRFLARGFEVVLLNGDRILQLFQEPEEKTALSPVKSMRVPTSFETVLF